MHDKMHRYVLQEHWNAVRFRRVSKFLTQRHTVDMKHLVKIHPQK